MIKLRLNVVEYSVILTWNKWLLFCTDCLSLQMVKRFVSRGMGEADAKVVVSKMAQYEGFFVNLMVTEELGLQLPEDDDASLLTDAFLMALSFALIGCLPLLTYFLGMATALKLDDQQLFIIGAVVSGLLLFALGSMKSCFSNVLWVLSGFESLLVAAICAAAAFAVGSGLRSIV
jgi:vacuolar iron transporter family protein